MGYKARPLADPCGRVQMNPIDKIEARALRNDIPDFRPGDTVRVHLKIQESGK